MGWIYLGLTIIGFSVSALCLKLGSLKKCDSSALTFFLFAAGAVYSSVFMLSEKTISISMPLFLLGIMSGLGSLAILFFIEAVTIGHYGFSVAIMSSSFLFPVLFATIFWKESASFAGIALLVIALLLMAHAGSSGNTEKKFRLKWLGFILTAFFFNGVPQIASAIVTRMPDKQYFLFLFLSYFLGAALFLPKLTKNSLLDLKLIAFGSLSAGGSFAGLICSLKALETLSANIVFPVYMSGYTITSVLLSFIIFRDKISLLGLLGVIVGIIGIFAISS